MLVLASADMPEIAEIIAKRKRLGIDGHDEIWEGVYHVTPYAHFRHGLLESELNAVLRPLAKARERIVSGAFNLGTENDFRVPDLGIHDKDVEKALYMPTASMVVEILSPNDESFTKIPFYAKHGVEEILIVDPENKTVRCFTHPPVNDARAWTVSRVLGLSMADLEQAIDWP